MLPIIGIHVGLFKYLWIELPKKRTLKEFILFLKVTFISYIKGIWKIIADVPKIFDKNYIEEQKKFKRYNQVKSDLNRALKMLQYIDDKMEKSGMNRQRRRQFWADFLKNGNVRKDIFENLLKEVK